MISKYNRLKAALAITDTQLQEFCDEINVSRHAVRRYYKGKLNRPNYYLDQKLDELWESAILKINKHEKQKAFKHY